MTAYVGDSGANVFLGTSDSDQATGLGGNDTFDGAGGDDFLDGGDNEDSLTGGGGADTLLGGDGNDALFSHIIMPNFGYPYTGYSLDILADVDILRGGAGEDYLFAGYGDDVDGGADRDRLYISFLGATSGVQADFRPLQAGSTTLSIGTTVIANIESVLFLEGSNHDDLLAPIYSNYATFGTVYGRGGNDHIIGDYYSGEIYGGDGNDIIDGRANAYGPEMHGEAGNDLIQGGRNMDELYGGADADDLRGGGNFDLLYGGTGNDILHGQDAGDNLNGEDGNDTIYGGDGSDQIFGGQGDDILYGDVDLYPEFNLTPGNDTLTGGTGADTMRGGAGNDIYEVENAGDFVEELAGEGSADEVRVSIATYTMTANVERLTSSATTAGTLRGNASDNLIVGGSAGGLFLLQDGGVDQVTGSAAAETFYFGAAFTSADIVNASAGHDALILQGSYATALPTVFGIEELILLSSSDNSYGGGGAGPFTYGITVSDANVAGGTNFLVYGGGLGAGETLGFNGAAETNGRFTLLGGAAADSLTGGAGADTINGGAGNDVMAGGAGNDIYFVDADDSVTELADQGIDEVRTTLASFDLAGRNIENLTGLGPLGQQLAGTDGVNIIDGGDGNDVLDGRGGNDVLIGGAGADVMRGGLGNDIYRIEDSTDIVIEPAGEGDDTVSATASYQLVDGLSVETMTTTSQAGTAAINLIGNEIAQSIFGNAGNNLLIGGGGDDQLIGYEGNDILEGAAGFDVMRGNSGNDFYRVEDTLDIIFEVAGEGDDTVSASANYQLADGLSIETMTAVNQATTFALNLIGNEIAQSIFGNAGNNLLVGGGGNDQLIGYEGNDILEGGAGFDVMRGNSGNDTYRVEDTLDQIFEVAGEGDDTILASTSYALGAGLSVETMTAYDQGTTNAFDLTGNELGQSVSGNNGANVLNGGLGIDLLRGYGGADSFAFNTALGAGNWDVIADFATGTDKIVLDNSVFAGLAEGNLSAGQFVSGSAAADADDRIIWNAATNQLFFDADGNGAGAAVLFAIVNGSPSLQASDFMII